MHRSHLSSLTSFLAGIALFCGSCHSQEGGQVPPAEAIAEWPAHLQASITGENRVPYISTYYIQPKVPAGQNATLNYYVTDHEQREYLQEDHSKTFTIDYWVNGAKKTLTKVKAGDNTLTLSNLPAGKVLLALQATDSEGRKTHRLFQEFLVINPADDVIPAAKVLSPDLQKFGISNDGTNPVETSKGLTEMLQWASDNGFRKVVLPKGTYLLDENSTVKMATKLTLDMNGATFKLNPNALARALMFEFAHCFDSHVINGTFEGDLQEHDFKTAPQNSEWVNAVNMGKDTEYCSLENVKVLNVTGYGTTTSIGAVGEKAFSFTRIKGTGKFIAGDIGETGNSIPSDLRCTTAKPVDIAPFVDSLGFIQLGPYLGYQGNPAGNWVYKASFYDAEGKFLENIEGFMYRRLYPPKAARTARFTLYSRHFVDAATQPEITVFNFQAPYNCAFLNVQHENVRCVGMVPSGFNNLLVQGCSFENCGSASARCAFDAEDGWDLMQDLTFRKNVFGKNPNNEFLTCAGHNFVMEDNVMKVHMWDRTRSAIFRNNKIKAATFLVAHRSRSGFVRIDHNQFEGPVNLQSASKYPDQTFCVRDCTLPPNSRNWAGKAIPANMGFFYRCKVEGGNLNGRYVDCDIKNVEGTGGTFQLEHCTLQNCQLRSSGLGTVSSITGSTLTSSRISTQGGSTVSIQNSKLTDTDCVTGQDWSPGHEFSLTANKVTTGLPQLVAVGNSYKSVSLIGNEISSSNPNFSAVRLINPTKPDLLNQSVTLSENKVTAPGGTFLDIVRLPNQACVLNLTLYNNKLAGLQETTPNVATAANVKISRSQPGK